MKKLVFLLLMSMTITISGFSQQEENKLEDLEYIFEDNDLYSLLTFSNKEENGVVFLDLTTDQKTEFKNVTYNFEDNHFLKSYEIEFKDNQKPDIEFFCQLYGDCEEVNEEFVFYGTNDNSVYAKLTADYRLIISRKD